MGDPKGFMTHTRRAPKYLPATLRLKNHEEHIEIMPDEAVRTQASTAAHPASTFLEQRFIDIHTPSSPPPCIDPSGQTM